MTEPVLSIKDLSVSLPAGADRRNAVSRVNLDINPGEILCIVGESGSGKSVTAQAVMGLLPKKQLLPTGEIRLEGEELLSAGQTRLQALRGSRMAMIFQEPMTALNPVMTVGKQIAEVFEMHTKLSPADRAVRARKLMESVHLPEPERMLHAYPHQLSGGQRQRIMIAMALALDPVLLVADEPTTALDVTTQAQILKLIRELQRQHGTAVMFITHDFGVVAEIADRVAVMKSGEIVETGTMADVLTKPQHPYTKMLIAAVPSVVPKHRDVVVSSEVVLSTDHLTKIYAGGGFFQKQRPVRAVSDVALTVRRGETLGIVGESGSGKSTVARCIARLIDPSEGSVKLIGEEIATLSASALRPYRRRIQIVFQDPYRSLNPRRTIGKSLIEGARNFGVSDKEAWSRAHELLRLVGIDPSAVDRYPHQFSGGQRQRICIARALIVEPEVLIADEAVSALDVSVQAQVLRLLDDIRQRFNLAMLFITHDLRVAAQICDRVAVMHRGVIVEMDSAQRIFTDPQHAYTRALFDAAPGRGFTFGTAA
ncbi:MAG: ABC transporter ATP-binding protein [Rhodospirillales bacterium]